VRAFVVANMGKLGIILLYSYHSILVIRLFLNNTAQTPNRKLNSKEFVIIEEIFLLAMLLCGFGKHASSDKMQS